MTKFEAIFGIKESDIKETCILMPLLPKGGLDIMAVKKLSKGKIYSSGNSKNFTLIITGIGPGFTGDAMLYLADTGCKKAFLFGSCGLVKSEGGLDIASLVVPARCFAMESFTDMLLQNNSFEVFYPDISLVEDFTANNKACKATCATLGSLKLEEENIGLFMEKDIQVVDMECSSFLSAARYKHIRAMALFYVSDIIAEKPFYIKPGREDEIKLSSSIKSGIKSLCSFATSA